MSEVNWNDPKSVVCASYPKYRVLAAFLGRGGYDGHEIVAHFPDDDFEPQKWRQLGASLLQDELAAWESVRSNDPVVVAFERTHDPAYQPIADHSGDANEMVESLTVSCDNAAPTGTPNNVPQMAVAEPVAVGQANKNGIAIPQCSMCGSLAHTGHCQPAPAPDGVGEAKLVSSQDFSLLMDAELRSNAHKGDWSTWNPSVEQAVSELEHHATKLKMAIFEGIAEKVTEYAADTGNICAKIVETFGKPSTPTPSVEGEDTDGDDEVDGRFIGAVCEYASTCDGPCAELTSHSEMRMDPLTQLGYCERCVPLMDSEIRDRLEGKNEVERAALPSNPPAPDLAEDVSCAICGQMTDQWTGDPGRWPLRLEWHGGNGEKRVYHRRCVISAIAACGNPPASEDGAGLPPLDTKYHIATQDKLMEIVDANIGRCRMMWEKTQKQLEQRERQLREALAQSQRLMDLVRHQRSELLSEKLISLEEWTALTSDAESGQRVARLESYDALRDQLAQMTERADRLQALLQKCEVYLAPSLRAAPDEIYAELSALRKEQG